MNTMTRTLVSLAIAGTLVTGITACGGGTHAVVGKPTTTGAVTSQAAQGVDVEAIWATTPLPPCDEIVVGNLPAPPGVKLPSAESVGAELRGVKSPAPEAWIRTKLGWLDYNLVLLRAAVADHPDNADSQLRMFEPYVQHVRTELIDGKDIPDHRLDSVFSEKC